jgi:16S rRNA (cytidine1402-2'-O)-methyltransferase
LPVETIGAIRGLRHFVAENARTARAFLAQCGLAVPIRELSIEVLDEHTRPDVAEILLAPLTGGHPLGLLSEAGCPAIADPGAWLVRAAHARGIPVVPLVGPSSLLLALMASGLEGQRFTFCGYLPRKLPALSEAILSLERRSRSGNETQVFIETPYRNDAIIQALLSTAAPDTQLCVASSLTLPDQKIRTASIATWRKQPPAPGRQPSVYLLLAATRTRA